MPNFVIEKSWYYKNLQCSVIFTHLGFRCGYVTVPKGYYIPKAYDYADLRVHGGITFDATIKHTMGIRVRERGMHIADGSRMVGFDCGHAWDGQDIELALKLFGVERMVPSLSDDDDEPKTQEFCETECRDMVNQIIEINRGKAI